MESSHVSTLGLVAWKALVLALCLEKRLDGSRCAKGVTLLSWCQSACLGSTCLVSRVSVLPFALLSCKRHPEHEGLPFCGSSPEAVPGYGGF